MEIQSRPFILLPFPAFSLYQLNLYQPHTFLAALTLPKYLFHILNHHSITQN